MDGMTSLRRRWAARRAGLRTGRIDCSPSAAWEIGALGLLIALGLVAARMLPGDTRPAGPGAAGNNRPGVFDAVAAVRAEADEAPVARASSAASRGGTSYFIRPDGGDAGQCDGRRDAPYPGSGRGRACAWHHPFVALPPGGLARIDGGDTLVIGEGEYMMGEGAPGTNGCAGVNCHMASVPSGPSRQQPTRIIAAKGARPVLWGTGGARRVLDLENSSNVEVAGLEITDRSDCASGHPDPAVACRTQPPRGDWARTGVYARNSNNVLLRDLRIHGLAHTGINAGRLRDWMLERVAINANGRAGWDGNVGKGTSSNSGRIVMRDIEIGWNGCAERWRRGEPWACWAQKSGGYGDGLGTQTTGGDWLIEDAHVHHNTSDGLDLRYMDGADSTRVTVRRLYAVANAGNQLKIRGNARVEESVLVGRCGFFRTRRDRMLEGDHCRAGGNTLQLVLTPGDLVYVGNNTITGEGGALVGANEGDDSARIRLQNNVLIGAPSLRKPGVRSAAYYANKAPAEVSWADNLVWQVKGNGCPGDSVCNRKPPLADLALGSFDARPLASASLADKVGAPSQVVRDMQRKVSATAGSRSRD